MTAHADEPGTQFDRLREATESEFCAGDGAAGQMGQYRGEGRS